MGRGEATARRVVQRRVFAPGGIEFWRIRQRVATGQAAEAAAQRFAKWQADTSEAIETLVGSDSLTRWGRGSLKPCGVQCPQQRLEPQVAYLRGSGACRARAAGGRDGNKPGVRESYR